MAKAKRFMVMPRTDNILKEGIKTGKGHRKFYQRQMFWVKDPGEAREIEQKYGMKGSKEALVLPDPKYEHHLNNEGEWDHVKQDSSFIHHYTFGPVSSPGVDAFWRRYNRKKKLMEKRRAEGKDPSEVQHGKKSKQTK